MIRAGIINVTGYAGAELARILHRHPEADIACVTGRSAAGRRLGEVFPHLSDVDVVIEEELSNGVDVAFSALPHKASAEKLIPLVEAGVRSVDLSADFRLRDPAEFREWYGVEHPGPERLEDAVYGLPELHRGQVAGARLVGNPGCYPTGAILALAPAVKEGIITPDIIIDGKSGVSGAGRGLSMNTHFSEVNENFKAYSLQGHRHLPEITQELGLLSSAAPRVTFLTHLAPMTRGILNSCYAPLKEDAFPSMRQAQNAITEMYREFYRDEPFVKVTAAPPQTKETWGNNLCLIHPVVDVRTGRLMVISCLDNLVKGAAGQAVQNMNLMMGLPETLGLESLAVYP